ncbi:DUF924 family protein [Kushneria aurantia]|uniref:DUF924 family protein n=1 Tax=Kushneria aurantia TaxID=504092 RepID=A0ABV6G2K8_9GAMM|nr:DUF924 family protein [Kushneria aurantia]
MSVTPEEVLAFWFEALTPQQWFRHDPALDNDIAARFAPLTEAARRCELSTWRDDDRGRLAEIIVIDQFSRNLYRDDPRAFSHDPLALALAQQAVTEGVDGRLSITERPFLYMPYMHSESLIIHQQALALFDQPGLERNLDAERRHLGVLERFGRYPQRNAALGRDSSAAELAFLDTPGNRF